MGILDWISSRQTLGIILLTATLVLACYFFYTLFKPHQWIFSVQAQSQIVELVTAANKETRWRVNQAILCVRGSLQLPVKKFVPLSTENPACGGGKRWVGYHMLDLEQTLVLTGAIKVVFELAKNKTLFMALRTPQHGIGSEYPVSAHLSFTDGTTDINLGTNGKLRVNIIFPAASSNIPIERIFPFTGETTIGRDINWTGSSLLTKGIIEVYTADNSPDKRKRVDSANILLGDQLRLYSSIREDRTTYPKGFLRLKPNADYFDVIAFGSANHVRVERFGDNGYNFKPDRLLLLLNDQGLILAISIFITFVALISGIARACRKKDCA